MSSSLSSITAASVAKAIYRRMLSRLMKETVRHVKEICSGTFEVVSKLCMELFLGLALVVLSVYTAESI